jgi:hypothetical protein
MNSGWIKLHRKSLNSGWLKNHKLWVFWSYCLLKASHKQQKNIVGFKNIIVEQGQFLFGRHKASEETGLSEQEIRTCKTFLEKSGNITSTATNRYSIITIVNWALYQVDSDEPTSTATNKQPTSNQQVTTYKNERMKEGTDICQQQAVDDNDSQVIKPKIPQCPHTAIINIYHEILPELPCISTKVVNSKEEYNWQGTRSGHLQARWRGSERRQSLDWWRGYFERVKESDFLMGKTNGTNGRSFKADLGWLIKPENFNKVVEGKYTK